VTVLGVLCAVRGAPEEDVVMSLEGAGPGVEVARRCADVTELLAAAGAGLGRIAVVSGDLPGLDREAVALLSSCGVTVLAVVDPGRPWEREKVQALGVPTVVDLAAPDLDGTVREPGGTGADVVAAVRRLLETVGGAPGRLEGAGTTTAAVDATAPTPSDPGDLSGDGQLVVVWGPTGAPGRTTLAVNLAAELAALAGPAVLVDADTYGGTVAQLVGLLDEAPGLAAAARAAGSGVLDVATLLRLAPMLSPGLRVLSGISRADRWTELPASALEVIWDLLRVATPWTVVDTGFCLERDEVLSYDTRAPSRNAATLSTLEAADVLVVVGGADPIGIHRLVRALDEVGRLAPCARRVVVANRVRAGTAGPRPGPAIRQALERYAGVTDVVLVPDDTAAVDDAVLSGRLLRESAPTSSARHAIELLAADLVEMRTCSGAAGTSAAGPGAHSRLRGRRSRT
jgi:MinD-like ATPase involved in chromosome partitioning or flagellar assembly